MIVANPESGREIVTSAIVTAQQGVIFPNRYAFTGAYIEVVEFQQNGNNIYTVQIQWPQWSPLNGHHWPSGNWLYYYGPLSQSAAARHVDILTKVTTDDDQRLSGGEYFNYVFRRNVPVYRKMPA